MSFTFYQVDIGIDASQIFWAYDSVSEHVELCDYETTLPLFLRYLPKNEPILDAGCGLARWVIYLRARGYRVFGVDCAHAALAQALRQRGGLPLLAGDTLALPIRDETLGGIISMGVVEHAPEGPVRALRELRRVLRAGGIGLIGVPYDSPFRRCVTNHVRRLRDWQKRRAGLKLDFAEYRFTAAELAAFLEEAGFEVLSVHADDFKAPFGKGLWVDSSALFGYRIGMFDLAPGHKRWELNRLGQIVQRVANAVSPWLVAGGVLAVARRR